MALGKTFFIVFVAFLHLVLSDKSFIKNEGWARNKASALN